MPDQQSLHKPRVIIAHSSPIFNSGAQDYIRRKFLENPRCAATTEELDQKLAEAPPDIVILNERLRGKENNYIALLKERYPAMKIILITECDDNHYLTQMANAGVGGFVHPDTEPKDLCKAIPEVMQEKFFYCPKLKPFLSDAAIERILREKLKFTNGQVTEFFNIKKGLSRKECLDKESDTDNRIKKLRAKIRKKLREAGRFDLLELIGGKGKKGEGK